MNKKDNLIKIKWNDFYLFLIIIFDCKIYLYQLIFTTLD